MRYLLTSIVLGAFLAGCAPARATGSASTPAAPAGDGSSGGATALPPGAPATAQGAQPDVVTVRPPMRPVVPAQGTPAAGWQTFTSTALGVSVDYPEGWSAVEQPDGVTFTLPQGGTILLQPGAGGSASSAADCSKVINSYGQSGRLCFDAAASLYSASFQKPGGSAAWVTLSTVSSEKPAVFYQMFDSLRPAQ